MRKKQNMKAWHTTRKLFRPVLELPRGLFLSSFIVAAVLLAGPAAAQRPSAPTLTAPLNGATNVSTTPSFTWTAVTNGGAIGNYRIQIATNAADLSTDPDSAACGASCVVNTTAGLTNFTPGSALANNTTYTWQVHALGTLGGVWSTRFSFTTAANFQSDLVVENLLVNPRSMLPGDAITVSFTVHNQGTAGAGPSKTRIRLNTSSTNVTTADHLLAEFTTPSLSPGAPTAHNIASAIPSTTTPGSYFVWVILDVENALNQSNVANDRANKPITVNVPSQPQLSVTPMSLNFGSVQQGTTKQSNFTVKNTGGGALIGGANTAGPFSIVGDGSFSLGAGEFKKIVVQFSPNALETFVEEVQVSSNGGMAVVSLEGQGGPTDAGETPGSGTVPIIFIPGMYGTQLCKNGDCSGGEVWPAVQQVCDFGDSHLEVLRPNDEGEDVGNISPGGVIGRVQAKACGFKDIDKDFYKDFLGFLNHISKVEEFPYDWRLDIEQTADKLGEFVNNLTVEPGSKVDIVAHSTGGLVAKAYLSKDPRNEAKVRNLIMITTPHFGTPKALWGLLLGEDDAYGKAQSVVDKDRISHIATNMPSAYQLLPSQLLNDYQKSFVDLQDFDEDGKKGELSYSDLLDMLANQSIKWGRPFFGCPFPFDSHLDVFCHEPLNSHIRTWVSVHERLDGWVPSPGLKAYLLVGTGERTIGGLSCNRVGLLIGKGVKCDRTWVKDDQGDGTVPAFSAEAGNVPGFIRSHFKPRLRECISSPSQTSDSTLAFSFCLYDSAEHLELLGHSEVRAKIDEIFGAGTSDVASSTAAVTAPSQTADEKTRWIEFSLESDEGILRVFDFFGNHLGPPKEGAVNERIDRGQYFEMGTLKTAVVPEPGLYTVTIEASENGVGHLRVTEYSGSDPVQVLHYPEIPLSSSGIASITFQEVTPEDAVEVDQDGDGQVDSLIFPLQAPVANAGLDQIAFGNVVVTLDASKSLPVAEGPLSYSWAQIAGPQVSLSSNSAATPQFIASEVITDTVLTFQLVVSDEFGSSSPDTVAVTIKVPTGPLTIGASSLSNGEVGVGYNVSLGVVGGLPPYTTSVISGSLPLGLKLGSPTIIGTPQLAGSKRFTIRVTDQLGTSLSKRFNLSILKALAISTNTLKAGTRGKNYKGAVKATGGKKPYSWSELSGNLTGTGLTLNNSTGAITGIPTQPGTFNLTFQVSDSLGGQAQKNLTLTVN